MREPIVVRTVMPSSARSARVVEHAGVAVERAALGQRDEVAALLRVDEQDAVAGDERSGHGALPAGPDLDGHLDRRPRPPASEQNAQAPPVVVGAPHSGHGASSTLLLLGLEPLVAAGEEAVEERRLRAGRLVLERVEHFLEPEVPVALRHRALLDLVVDAAQHAVRRHLALTQPHERLHLAGEARRPRAAPGTGDRGSRSPSAARCRAAPRLRRRGCDRSRRRRSRARARSS